MKVSWPVLFAVAGALFLVAFTKNMLNKYVPKVGAYVS